MYINIHCIPGVCSSSLMTTPPSMIAPQKIRKPVDPYVQQKYTLPHKKLTHLLTLALRNLFTICGNTNALITISHNASTLAQIGYECMHACMYVCVHIYHIYIHIYVNKYTPLNS